MNEVIRVRIALSLIKGIGAKRTRILMDSVSDPHDIFRTDLRSLCALDKMGIHTAQNIQGFTAWDKVDSILEFGHRNGVRIVVPEDDEYPEKLLQLDDHPVLLWVKGDVNLLKSAGIAVVGTRSPSSYGKNIARDFTSGLVSRNATIISGLAYGIDTIAHSTAVREGGRTIAVLGSGIDRIYPQSNAHLADMIVDNGGALVSEFAPGTKPDYHNFPVRNRIVSGLSWGILVVETAETGGSMITANLAVQQNRDVFVIPHELGKARGTGCHRLIRDLSGKLVENVYDIISEYQSYVPEFDYTRAENGDKRSERVVLKVSMSGNIEPNCNNLEQGNGNDRTSHEQLELTLTEHGKIVWDQIKKKRTIHFDQIVVLSGLSVSMVSGVLLELEMTGLIRQAPGKVYEVNAS